MIEVILFLKSSKDICYIILSELFALLVFHHQKHLLVKYLFTAVHSKLEFTSKTGLLVKINQPTRSEGEIGVMMEVSILLSILGGPGRRVS